MSLPETKSKVKFRDLHAIELLKEIYHALDTKRGSEDEPDRKTFRFKKEDDSEIKIPRKTFERPVRNFHEQVWYKSIGAFLEAQPDSKEEQMLNLLHSAKEILSDNVGNLKKTEKEIYKVLEEIINIGCDRGIFKDFFEDVDKVSHAISELNFNKRISLTSKRGINIKNQNLLNYIANTINQITEELQAKWKEVEEQKIDSAFVNGILNLKSQPRIIITTDSEDVIKYKSFGAKIYHFDNVNRKRLFAKEFIYNFETVKQKILNQGGVRHLLIKLILNNKESVKPEAYLTGQVVYDGNNKFLGLALEISPSALS